MRESAYTPPLEPVPDEPAALARVEGERVLLIADYHAGIEVGIRTERGVTVPSRAEARRERLVSLVERTAPDRLVILGDLMHAIGDPGGAERGELEVLFETLPAGLETTLVKGNHDGNIESWLEGVEVVAGSGVRLGRLGVCHGHTWPDPDALTGVDVVCFGHEHPCVRLEDDVGGARIERVWLRGRLAADGFTDREAYTGLEWLTDPSAAPAAVCVPAFNDLAGGTWVNLSGQSFLSPFLPAGITGAEAYLLDGTRLGPYRSI